MTPNSLLKSASAFESKASLPSFPSQISISLISQIASALNSKSIPVMNSDEAPEQPNDDAEPEEHSFHNSQNAMAEQRYQQIESILNSLPHSLSTPTSKASLDSLFNLYNNAMGEIAGIVKASFKSSFQQVQGQLAKDYRSCLFEIQHPNTYDL